MTFAPVDPTLIRRLLHAVLCAALASSCATRPATVEKAGTANTVPGLEGRWEGAYFCKDGISESTLSFDVVEGDYVATLVAGGRTDRHGTKSLDYRLEGGLGFDREVPRRRGQPSIRSLHGDDVDRIAGEARFLNIGMGGLGSDCKGMLMHRFVPIAGLGGEYVRAEGLHSLCDIVEQQWLPDTESEEAAGRTLKTELPRMLAGYDPARASVAGVYSADRFRRTFGLSPEELDGAQQAGLREQLRLCALLTDRRQRNVFQSTFFAPRSLASSMRVTIGTYWSPRLDVPLKVPLDSLGRKARTGQKAMDRIGALVGELRNMNDVDLIHRAAMREGVATEDVPPSELKSVLEPLISHVRALDHERSALRWNDVGELDVPYDRIPRSAHSMFQDLQGRREVAFDVPSMQYLAGMGLFSARECRLPANDGHRREVLDFAMSALQRAGLGASYDAPAIVTNTVDMLSSRLSFESGFETASRLGCESRFNGQVASLIGTGVATNRGSESDLSLFVRSCAVTFDLRRCDCLQSQLQAVFPDIGTREYRRSYISSAIRRSPLIGAGMVARCNIGNY